MTHDVDNRWEATEARLSSNTVFNIIIVETTQFKWNRFTHVVYKFSTEVDKNTSVMYSIWRIWFWMLQSASIMLARLPLEYSEAELVQLKVRQCTYSHDAKSHGFKCHRRSQGYAGGAGAAPQGNGKIFFLGNFYWNEAKMGWVWWGASPQMR